MTITLRTIKGSPLTSGEIDANFTNLNNNLAAVQVNNITTYPSTASIPLPYTGVARVGTDLYVGDGGAAVAVGGGAVYRVLDSGNATTNVTNLQNALILYKTVSIVGDPTTGLFNIDDTIIIPSNRDFRVETGTTLKGASLDHRVLMRLGNVSPTGSRTNWNWQVLFHSTVTATTLGTVRLVKAGGNWSLSYKLSSDATYGSAVVITTDKKIILTTTSGAWIAVRIPITGNSLADGTYTQTVKAIPTSTPATLVSLVRTAGPTKTINGNFTSGSNIVSGLSTPVKAGTSLSATGYIADNTWISYSEEIGSYVGKATLNSNATATGGNIAITQTLFNIVTVTETAHNRSVGDLVMFVESTGSNFTGLFRIISVTDANTYVYHDQGSYIGSTSTVYAFSSHSIKIECLVGARIESRDSDAAVYTESYLNYFYLVNRFTVQGGIWKNFKGKYCGNLQAITLGEFDGLFFDNTCSDGFTCQGSMYDTVIRNTSGNSFGDNIHGCGTAGENSTIIQSSADLGFNSIDNILFDNIRFHNQSLEPIRFFGSYNSNINNITVRNISGSFAASGTIVGIMQDSGTGGLIQGSNANFSNITIENASAQVPPGNTYNVVSCNGVSINTCYVKSLTLTDCVTKFDQLGATLASFLGAVSTTAVNFGLLTLNNNYMHIISGNISTFVAIQNCTNITVTINGGQAIGLSDLVHWGTADVSNAVITINNVAVSVLGRIADVGSSGVVISALTISNCTGQTYTELANVHGGTSTVPCKIKAINNSTSSNVIGLTTSNYISASGVSIDGAKVTTIEPGNTFYNTNALYGTGVGTYICGTSTTVKLVA